MNYAGFGSLRPNDLDHSWCWPNPFHTETTRGHDFHRGREPLDILGWAIYMILYVILHMGLSENSVPLNPMVNDHYPYQMAIIGGIHHFQTYPYAWWILY